MSEIPYTPDADRVCAYLQEITGGQVGCGEDPVGFLIASHRALAEERRWHDMADAPKDGTRIDLMFPHPRGRKVDCYWGRSELAGRDTWLWREATWGKGSIEPLPEHEWTVHCLPNIKPLAWRYPPPAVGASPAARKAYVYFSRIRPPHPSLGKFLASGVIEAGSATEAKAKLQAAIAAACSAPPLSSADDFTFVDLTEVERTGNGMLVVTLGEV